jgi:hypothetical protein
MEYGKRVLNASPRTGSGPEKTHQDGQDSKMSKAVVAIVAAAIGLAGCQPGGAAGAAPAAETRLAAKLVDLGVPIPLDGEGMQQAAFQAVQGMMFQDGLSQEQARQVLMGISKNLEASKPEIKETLIKSLTDEFNVKELELLVQFVASKEGMAIQEKMPVVGNKGGEQMQALVQQAATKALADVRAAWPVPPPPAPPAPAVPPDATPPGAVPAPALPN